VGEVCHIRGHKPDAARYDAAQSEAQRHAFENLILLCSEHHTVVDRKGHKYTVEWLQEIKRRHEAATYSRLRVADSKRAAVLLSVNRAEVVNHFNGPIIALSPNQAKHTAALIDSLRAVGVFRAPVGHDSAAERLLERPRSSEHAPDIATLLRDVAERPKSKAGTDALVTILRRHGSPLQVAILSKLEQDIHCGCLGSWESIADGLEISRRNLADADFLRQTEILRHPVPLSEIRCQVPRQAFCGEIQDGARKAIDQMARNSPDGKIIFDAQGLHVGLIATIKAMSKRLALPVRVRLMALDGGEQFKRLNQGDDAVDFTICANANIFTLGRGGAMGRYRYIVTFMLQPQYIVLGEGSTSVKRLRYVNGSSGEEQAKALQGQLPASIVSPPGDLDFVRLPAEMTTLERDDGLLSWDPLVSHLSPRHNHIVLQSERYQIATSLYAASRWLTRQRRLHLSALLEGLIAGWKIVRSDVGNLALDLATDQDLVGNIRGSMLSAGAYGLGLRL
jgi:hypothetical protein